MNRLILYVLVIGLMAWPYSGNAIDESAVLYFSFDEGNGVDVKDSSPAKNHGKFQGKPEWTDGKIGKAMQFTANGFVEITHTENLNLTKAHTISYWFKWNGQGASWSPFIAKTSGGGPKEDNFHTWVGKDRVWDYENQPNGQTHAVTRIPLDDKWIHLTVTHDGKKKVSFYIDGEEDAATNELPTTVGNKVNVRVGDDGKGNKGAGTIDELLILQRALTGDEIKQLYTDGAEIFLAVQPEGKLATTWGSIKNRR